MINLYLFNNKNRGAFYGVGSYVRELVASLRGSGIRIHVVYLFGEKAQIERWEEGEVSYLSFPEPVAEDRLGGAAAGGLFPEYRLSASPLYPGYGEAGVSFELL